LLRNPPGEEVCATAWTAHRIPFFVPFLLFVVNSLASVPCEPKLEVATHSKRQGTSFLSNRSAFLSHHNLILVMILLNRLWPNATSFSRSLGTKNATIVQQLQAGYLVPKIGCPELITDQSCNFMVVL
jgi:hypothetical protein